MTDWESQGCSECRKAALSVNSDPTLRFVADCIEAHARLHQCELCGAYWIENEREMHEISASEASKIFRAAE
jgi:hypothetical protein